MHRKNLKNQKEDQLAVLSLDVIFFLYLMLGLYGSVWSMDDFDAYKIILFGYIGLPLAIAFFGLRFLFPYWGRKFPKAFYGLLITLGLVFMPGHILLFNAMTAQQKEVKRTIATATSVVYVSVQKGGLGFYIKKRW